MDERDKKLLEGLREHFKEVAKQAMETMGHIVVAEDGWVVKKYKDGRIEKIVEIGTEEPLKLD